MLFLLYLNEEIIGGYGTVEILRLNLFILIYNLYSSKYLNKIAYKKLEEKLITYPFTIENFEDTDFKGELVDAGIKIETTLVVNKPNDVLNKIKMKLDSRFDQLEEILNKDIRIKVTFPGQSAVKHRLGTMYVEDWKLIDQENYHNLAQEMHHHITQKILHFEEVFGERVKFGDVLYQNANSLSYQVWSANAINYDLKEGQKIPGDYQALEMKVQGPGVFGIITTPKYGY